MQEVKCPIILWLNLCILMGLLLWSSHSPEEYLPSSPPQTGETGRLEGTGEMSFPTWNKLLVKSSSLESRHLLWGNLRLCFIMITTPLLLPQAWGDIFQIFIFRIWWGFWRQKPMTVWAPHKTAASRKFPTLMLVCTHPQAIYHLFMPLKCS